MEDKVYFNTDHSSQVLMQMSELWKAKKLCDAIIEVGPVRVYTHRILLLASCPWLMSLIDGDEEETSVEIRLPLQIGVDALNSVLSYLYDGILSINFANLQRIEHLNNIFKVQKISEFCQDFRNYLENDKLAGVFGVPQIENTPISYSTFVRDKTLVITFNETDQSLQFQSTRNSCTNLIARKRKYGEIGIESNVDHSPRKQIAKFVSCSPLLRAGEQTSASGSKLSDEFCNTDAGSEVKQEETTDLIDKVKQEPIDWESDSGFSSEQRNESISNRPAKILKSASAFSSGVGGMLYNQCTSKSSTGLQKMSESFMENDITSLIKKDNEITDCEHSGIVSSFDHVDTQSCQKNSERTSALDLPPKVISVGDDDNAVSETENLDSSKSSKKRLVSLSTSRKKKDKEVLSSDTSQQVEQFKCTECNKLCKFRSELERHLRVHTKESKFVCASCGLGFGSLYSLKRHENSLHEHEKSYQCKTCGKQFVRKITLSAHEMYHNGKTPYSCQKCNKGFKYEFGLRKHKCEGKQERYYCQIFQKEFKHKKHLKHHMLIHDIPKYSCDTFGIYFTWGSSLKTHQKSYSMKMM